MPEITIELNEGRSIEQKRALCKGITEVVVETCKVPADRGGNYDSRDPNS